MGMKGENMTISDAMVLQKTIRERMNSLSSIRNQNVTRTRTFSYLGGGEPKEQVTIEPQYDPKAVDAKIVELEGMLFKLDTAIKKANAKTEIGIEVDIDKVLEPIK